MCDDKSADFFHCPAYKLLISDIRCAVPKTFQSYKDDDGDVEEDKEYEWYLTIHQLITKSGQLELKSASPSKAPLELHVKLVWLQGTVIRIDATDDTDNLSLIISDDDEESEEAIIYEYNTVPGGDHVDIKIGSYIGTLGQIWSINPVIVKATKIMHLSDNPVYKSMWNDEVTLGKAFLAGLILPSA